ncbi:beta strand repeat-containing protein [Dysgonomonas sp. GY617]|uniref:beta strand repeat-containing protein n=1 Tax=Dysgonomonas sp. GY617 TaxID=2780420 RepID=UPI0018837B4D|nr:hypothetical protein [Dysgonomonas sp. GY617]MBF0574511.1 hypothetical protein [Dysgonomonas sp. GY617]
MKKKVLFSVCLIVTATLQAQVGINNSTPKASLHITPQNTDGTTAEGIIAPNLTRAQLIGKDVRYNTEQRGAIIYVTTLDGTPSAKTTHVTATGYYYFDGTVWQPFTQPSSIIPTEPWQVQGSTTAATANAQNIYQTGSVGIGAMTAVPSAYMFQVTGSSNVTANSRVASSTVVGNQTVGGTLIVTGATTLNNALTVTGTTTTNATNIQGLMKYTSTTPVVGQYLRASNVDGSVAWATLPAATVTTANNGLAMSGTTTQLGGALTKATSITGTSLLTLATPTTVSGALQISSGTPAAGKFLTSDAAGNATWGTLPVVAVTTANNGLAMSGTATQLGGALTKATNITGTSRLTLATPTTVSGALQISSGTPAAGKFLTSDASGNATWGTLPAVAVTTANNGIAMSGTTTQLGGALTKATNITGTSRLTLATPTTVSGALQISSGTPAAGKFLTSDAAGNATWGTLPAATVTTANNGLAMSGTTTQLGGALTKATSITGSATNTLTIAAPTTVGTTAANSNLTVNGNEIVTGSVGIGIASPSQKLHVVGNEYITGLSKVGGNTTYNASAQLELSDVNKGFLPNRVALTSPTVKAPVANAVNGMLVYNTATVGLLKPGFYYWNNTHWQAFVTEIPENKVTGYDLTASVNSTATNPASSQGGTLMSFGDIGTTTKYFTIKDGGSYAFAIRVYGIGNLQAGKTMGRSCVYFTLMINGVKIDVQEVNWALVDPAIVGAQNRLGGTVMLTGNNLKVGDKVEFRLAHYNVGWSQQVTMSANPGLTADKTSLVFWKL